MLEAFELHPVAIYFGDLCARSRLRARRTPRARVRADRLQTSWRAGRGNKKILSSETALQQDSPNTAQVKRAASDASRAERLAKRAAPAAADAAAAAAANAAAATAGVSPRPARRSSPLSFVPPPPPARAMAFSVRRGRCANACAHVC